MQEIVAYCDLVCTECPAYEATKKTIIRPELRLPKNGVNNFNIPSRLKISIALVA